MVHRIVPPAAVLRLAVLALALPAGLALVPAAVAARTAPPEIVSFTARAGGTRPLPADGARVVLSIRVRHASTCTFLGQRAPFSSLRVLQTVNCSSGHATVTAPPIANRHQSQVGVSFAVRVQGSGSGVASRRISVLEAAATPPLAPRAAPAVPTAVLSITPSSLPASGGTVILDYTAANAATCSLLSSAPTLLTGSNPARVDCDGSYQLTVGPNTTGQLLQWTLTFTATNADGASATAIQTLTEQGATTAQSSNWSGYVVRSSTLLTSVSGAWTVPTPNCAQTPAGGASAWVGIGGVSWPAGGDSGVLLQTGIDIDCVGGVPQFSGWWEEYPSTPNFAFHFSGFPVSAGDQISASVYQGSTGAWVTRLDDLTTGLSGWMVTGESWGVSADTASGFAPQGPTAGLGYSGGYTAEWIVEDYESNGSQIPFADYGSVSFGHLLTSLSAWQLTTNDAVEIQQNGAVLSTPSPPVGDGFTVTYSG